MLVDEHIQYFGKQFYDIRKYLDIESDDQTCQQCFASFFLWASQTEMDPFLSELISDLLKSEPNLSTVPSYYGLYKLRGERVADVKCYLYLMNFKSHSLYTLK